ncbi:MAG: chemotaxis protein CheB [Candidatus Wallbacteria bacterium]|nr:chemotaxis protein CheB [Candidatus Wallbacteria bacterium]
MPSGMPAAEEIPVAGFPVVGIGASAGGLAAFEAFFSGMPADIDPGMAFVLVQHLAPDHKSLLAELIRRRTRMQVFEIEDGMPVQPNCAYIIPPNRDLAFLNGTLHLLEPASPHGQRLPIDFFFRSLAQDQRERAIVIVLSGTGCDGTLGIKAVKDEGGMAMAQIPSSTEYDGMPLSAISTGLVDFQLLPSEMPAQLIAYASHSCSRILRGISPPVPMPENALKKAFILLRNQTGHDFSQYKPSTVQRRIERRLAVHQIVTMDDYVRYLQQTPAEVEALMRDLLIGVTGFFRDPEAFQALESKVIPGLFTERPSESVIRVWSPGCSTGEEAYSIAILLQEHLDFLKQPGQVQVFATDIDSQAISSARIGLFPASIASDITPERLSRFFTSEPDGSAFRIRKQIRDMLIFSEQDLIKDPPFSKIDLISCRNLMIYLSGELQKRLIPLFHYALNPGGVLFLGTSETIGEFTTLFTALDRNAKLFQRKENHRSSHLQPHEISAKPRADEIPPAPRPAGKKATAKLPLRELTEQALLQDFTPACALVTSQGDIMYIHGRTGLYLEPVPGEAGVNNILKMAREGLRRELTTDLHKAVTEKKIIHHSGLRVKTNGDFTLVNLIIRPLSAAKAGLSEAPLYLVIFAEAAQETPGQAVNDATAGSAMVISPGESSLVAALRQELRSKEEYLESTNEELETANEELKSANEELQSVNEELQSSNEELETSKEEMQSINEELTTINAELQTKVTSLTRAGNDMNNLHAGTGITTIFLDHHLNILRFTPASQQIINLIPSDIGRPVAHVGSNLIGYDRLVADTQGVLDNLIPKEVAVQTQAGAWYAMRILPYRTTDNVIEGAVITFMEITEMIKAREARQESEELFKGLFENTPNAVALMETVQDKDGKPADYIFLQANPAFERHSGLRIADVLGKGMTQVYPPETLAILFEIFAKVDLYGEPISQNLFFKPAQRIYQLTVFRIRCSRLVFVFDALSSRTPEDIIGLDAVREHEETSNGKQG